MDFKNLNKLAFALCILITILVIALGAGCVTGVVQNTLKYSEEHKNMPRVESVEELQHIIDSSYGKSFDIIAYGDVVSQDNQVVSDLSSIEDILLHGGSAERVTDTWDSTVDKLNVDLVSLKRSIGSMNYLGTCSLCEHSRFKGNHHIWRSCEECSALSEVGTVTILGVQTTLKKLGISWSSSLWESVKYGMLREEKGWKKLNLAERDPDKTYIKPVDYVVTSNKESRYSYFVLPSETTGTVYMNVTDGVATVKSQLYLNKTIEQVVKNRGVFGYFLAIVLFVVWFCFITPRVFIISYDEICYHIRRAERQKVNLSKA